MITINIDQANAQIALSRKEVFICFATGLPVRSWIDNTRECRKGKGGVYVFDRSDNHCVEFWPDRLIANGLCKFKMP